MNEIELKYILGLEVRNFLDIISWAMIITGIITFFTTLYIRAPYGRYSASKGWGILLPARFAWFIMEIPNVVIITTFYLYFSASSCKNNLGNQLLSAMYIGHYINRAMIYPLRMNNSPNPMPISVTFLAFSYCCWNGLTQSLSLTIVNPKPEGWIYDIRFILGTIIFLIGMYINISSDAILFNIRLKAKVCKFYYYNCFYFYLYSLGFKIFLCYSTWWCF